MLNNSNGHFDQLNKEQLIAATHADGPMLVLAGAGTGKTKVLTSRITYLIQNGIAAPENILAVTFTNKAAKEMLARTSEQISVVGLNIGTFHSIAAKILRQHASLLNLTPSFTIIDRDDQIKLVKNISAELTIDSKTYPAKVTQSIISKWKDLGLLPKIISKNDLKSQTYHVAHRIYQIYQERLLNSNAVDFGDLLLYNNQIFTNNPEILKSYQNRFIYIMIDEYQDTNAVQYVWARMLANKYKNIFCVGDDDQSIYGWRGAEIGNILRFGKDFHDAKIVKLEQNYRSSTNILKAAASIISNNLQRHDKTLWTDYQDNKPINIITCWNEKEEASYITAEISKLAKQGVNLNNVAILVRAGYQTRPFEEALINSVLPYKIIGGLKFYERMEIKDILAYIRIIINNNDDLALERIINVPKRSIGTATINSIRSQARELDCSLLSAIEHMIKENLLKTKVHNVLEQFVRDVKNWQDSYQKKSAFDTTKIVIEESGYIASIKQDKNDNSQERIDNINEMLNAISEFNDINEFIEHTSLVMEKDEFNNDAINLMTLHAAKGLEFQTVFLPGWEEGIFPNQRVINEEGEKGIEEERRIAYVGITRAKENLYISHAESRRIFYEYNRCTPSRFLNEIPKHITNNTSPTKLSITKPKKEVQHNWPSQEKFRPGVKVKHNNFGNGIIIRKNGDNLEIAFDKQGIKTIRKDFIVVLN